MQFNKQLEPFKAPAPLLGITIYCLFGLLLSLTLVGFYNLFTLPSPTLQFKKILIVKVILLYGFIMVVRWYRYRVWSSMRKNELVSYINKDRLILYSKYNRLFLNFDCLLNHTDNPYAFKKLRQKDLREVEKYKNSQLK